MIKSIFARPVFINPQAYLVIPQLANLSMLEPIDFTSTNTYSFESLGKVESKIISAKDEYILHIDLYESYGSCVLGEFYIGPATIGSIDDFTITANGYITTIEVGGGDSGNIVYPGLIAAWSAKGKTNDDEDRAILKDLTGNGHDITLNGFAFSEMSGYGGYIQSWYKNTITNDAGSIIILNNSITFYPNSLSALNYGIEETKCFQPSDKPIRIKISGLKEDGSSVFQINVGTSLAYSYNKDGIYELQLKTGYRNIFVNRVDNKVIVELLPEYPDALVFDGVDEIEVS